LPLVALNERMNTVPAQFGDALILVCSYRGAARKRHTRHFGRLGALLAILTLKRLRDYVAMWRDFAANPRDAAYLRQLAETVLARCTGPRVVLDLALGEAAQPAVGSGMEVTRCDLGAEDPSRLPPARTVILIYPDPLGLSWGELEGALLRDGRSVFVVNGRRRFFALDREARRALALRRLLANTRLLELLAGLVVIPISAMLALRDKLAGRT